MADVDGNWPWSDYSHTTLDNGLRVVVDTNRDIPVVALSLWYGVGSRHERNGELGFAHLTEHLMFEGSQNIIAGGHSRLLQSIGATNVSASTSGDRTRYYETVPGHYLELALFLEADRMGSVATFLTESGLAGQREVVRNEWRQRYEQQPYGGWFGSIFELVFPTGHPYRHTVMGRAADIDNATVNAVRRFITEHYAPDNAVLTLAGDVEPDRAFEMIERHFAGIGRQGPASEPPAMAVPPAIGAEVRLTVRPDAPAPRVFLAYRIPPFGTAGWDHAYVLSMALGRGRGSILCRALVDELGVAPPERQFATVWNFAHGAAIFTIGATARSGVDVAAVEAAIHRVLESVADHGPSPSDLARARAVIRALWTRRHLKLAGRADTLSQYAVLRNDPALALTQLTRWLSVTADDVRFAAQRHLHRDNRAVLTYRPPP